MKGLPWHFMKKVVCVWLAFCEFSRSGIQLIHLIMLVSFAPSSALQFPSPRQYSEESLLEYNAQRWLAEEGAKFIS